LTLPPTPETPPPEPGPPPVRPPAVPVSPWTNPGRSASPAVNTNSSAQPSAQAWAELNSTGGQTCNGSTGDPCHLPPEPLPPALATAYRITDAILEYLNREPTITLPDGRVVPVATGTVFTPGVRGAASGTATLIQHSGRHASVAVRVGDEVLHTEQFVRAGQATIVVVEDAAPVVRQVTVNLPDAAAAMNYQRAVLGQATGVYNASTNSCVTHCGDVLRAGGLDVPSTTREIVRWLNTLGY
jgi:hypothetical protein